MSNLEIFAHLNSNVKFAMERVGKKQWKKDKMLVTGKFSLSTMLPKVCR